MSKQKEPRAHHYTPVWLSERFCDAEGLLWWRRRDWPEGKLNHNIPKNVFVKNNLNTRYTADGSRDVQIEKELAKIDGRIAGMTYCLVKQARQRRAPAIAEESLQFLYYYVFVQFKRPPEFWKGGDAKPNERVDAILLSDSDVSRVLDTKGMCLFSVPAGAELVVGSRVVIPAGAEHSQGRLEDPDRGLAFPLAADVLLGFVHGATRREHTVLTAEEVGHINHATAAHCEAIAAPSRETVLRAIA